MGWSNFGSTSFLCPLLLSIKLHVCVETSFGVAISCGNNQLLLLGKRFVCLKRNEVWGCLTLRLEIEVSWLSNFGMFIPNLILFGSNGFTTIICLNLPFGMLRLRNPLRHCGNWLYLSRVWRSLPSHLFAAQLGFLSWTVHDNCLWFFQI